MIHQVVERLLRHRIVERQEALHQPPEELLLRQVIAERDVQPPFELGQLLA